MEQALLIQMSNLNNIYPLHHILIHITEPVPHFKEFLKQIGVIRPRKSIVWKGKGRVHRKWGKYLR